ncbi:MAG: dockerin type I domain-containing protein [Clostridia bacterium]|nr:dockerin type I domain-containing protein [Clostridia bacterium]
MLQKKFISVCLILAMLIVGFMPTTISNAENLGTIEGFIDGDIISSQNVISNIRQGFTVEVPGTSYSTVTDDKGYFKLEMPFSTIKIQIIMKKSAFLERECILSSFSESVILSTAANPIKLMSGDMPVQGVQDKAINMTDILEVIKAFNTTLGYPTYEEILDLNQDKAINMEDIMVIVNNFNKSSLDYEPIVPGGVTAKPTPTNTPQKTEHLSQSFLLIRPQVLLQSILDQGQMW